MEPSRQDRRDAAAFAKERFNKKVDGQHKLVGIAPTDFQLAETAMEAKHEAEAKYDVKISMTLDVEGNWWFQ